MDIVHVTKDTFQAEVVEAPQTVLLDFWASWCGPCRMIAPILEQIAQEREDVKVCKIDVDSEGELAVRFGVMSIPMLVVMRGGEVVNTAIGVRPKAQILELL